MLLPESRGSETIVPTPGSRQWVQRSAAVKGLSVDVNYRVGTPLANLVKEPRVFWLSMHVPYACHDSGACCSSGWPIPIERSRVETVRLLRQDGSWLLPAPEAP